MCGVCTDWIELRGPFDASRAADEGLSVTTNNLITLYVKLDIDGGSLAESLWHSSQISTAKPRPLQRSHLALYKGTPTRTPSMSIMEYNGGSVVAMRGKNCVAIGGCERDEVDGVPC